MTNSKCSGCGETLTTNSYKEMGSVNDSYVLLYKCRNCQEPGYTVANNVQTVEGADVVEVLDKEVVSNEEIEKKIATHIAKAKL